MLLSSPPQTQPHVSPTLLHNTVHFFLSCNACLPTALCRRHSPAPFLFCVQLMVPCVPPIALVATWWVAMLIGYCAAPCDPDLPLLPPIALVATWWVT